MKCDKCGHEDYAVRNTSAGPASNTATITFNVTVSSDTAVTASTMPTFQFHVNCECCKNNHHRIKIAEAR